jgi:hypothetical protein
MTKKEPKSLFRRLTQLFRSGPVVKRKIRSIDTSIAAADKTKSSGTLLFQKSLSPTYATITSNAYNLSERLMRYQDFQEMEYSLSGDTEIPTTNGVIQLRTLAALCEANPNHQFIVYSYDHEKKRIVPAWGKQARQTCVDHAWKVTFDNNKSLTLSAEHRLMLRDGTYRKAEDLKPGDAMMPFYRKDLFAGAKEGTKGYSWVYTMDDRFRGWTKEHQLVAEWIVGRKLTEDECVHHINFDKSDNRPENLRIMSKSDHDSYHASINNGAKWAPENKEWIEEFKKNHAQWMRDNAPTRRHDVTFSKILETCERVGFNISNVCSTLDITIQLINERLVAQGFSNFKQFTEAYASGVTDAFVSGKPGLLTRDLSLDLIKSLIEEYDTKSALAVKLGCTVNVLDKFLARRARMTWTEVRTSLGFNENYVDTQKINCGRPRGSNGNLLTFQQICDEYTSGLTLPRLAEKLDVNKNTIISRLAQQGYTKYSEFQSSYDNCKVVSIEYVGEMPLYDFTVDGYKNFATDSVISHNTPEIAAALDIYADETCAQDDKGRVLHVYSENEKVKEVLEDLFYNVLNVEFSMRSWVRNLCKYGDFFLFNDVSPEYGVVNAFPIPVNEIEREENFDRDDPFAVRFRWVTLGNRTLENWEVSHFRLLGNDMFLPYGSSVIEPARRIWRQLILIEDAMLVYRVVRAPERRVFYIDVANVPPENVPMYVEEQRKNLRTNQVVDGATGRVDLRYNPLPVHKDTPVPLLDGTTMTIEALSKKMVETPDWTPWVYSVQDKTQRVVPGKVTWCGKNYTASKLTKVWLDDGSYVTTAPEHPFVMRDGSAKRADELIPGDSLMSAYRDLNNRGYERIVEPSGGRVSTHVMVARDVYSEKWANTNEPVVHHKHPELGVGNKRNNSPDNLEVMNFWDHRKMHSEHCELTLNSPERLVARSVQMIEYNKSDKHRTRTTEVNKRDRKAQRMGAAYNGSDLHKSHNENRRSGQRLSWDENKSGRSEVMRWIIPNEVVKFVFEVIKVNPKIGREELTSTIRQDVNMCSLLEQANTHNKRSPSQFHVNAVISKLVRSQSISDSRYGTFRKFAFTNPSPVNHQVVQIETLENVSDDVYCMTVTGPNCEDDRHNFAVNGLGTQTADNQLKSLVFVRNSVDEDYFIPVRGGDSGTKIDTLAGGQNTAAVEDVAYIQKKLFAALKIPRAYLGYDELLSSKATLAQEDIRFSRTISVIQKTILAELNKLAIIHLYAHGYDGDDLQNFTLHLSNPSTVAQQQKLELWRAKFEIGGSLPEGMGSAEWVQHQIWGLSLEEIDAINKQRIKEKAFNTALEANGDPDAASGGGADDLFGDAGGDVGDEEQAGDETPPEENAGEEPEEETEPEVSLLKSNDDNDDDESFALKLTLDHDASPVKPKNQVQKDYTYNRGRRRTHGASKTHMPDFVKMTGVDNRAMKDPNDNDFMKSIISNPLGEVKQNSPFDGLSPDVWSMLRRMSMSISRPQSDAIISESNENTKNDEIDFDKLSESVRDDMNEKNDLFIIDDDDDWSDE